MDDKELERLEKRRAYHRAYYQKHREKRIACVVRSRAKRDIEEGRLYWRAWYEKNREKRMLYQRQYRARKKAEREIREREKKNADI